MIALVFSCGRGGGTPLGYFVRLCSVELKLFYSWGRESAGDGADAVELLSQEFPAAEAAGPAILLGSLDRADYLPPPAAAPAPTDVAHMSIGPTENAG